MKSVQRDLMKKALSIFGHTIAVLLLTILTQVGGLIYLVCLLFYKRLSSYWNWFAVFLCVYLVTAILLLPAIAPMFGREALPIRKTGDLRPHTWWTCVLNRHYVTPSLRKSVDRIQAAYQQEIPDVPIVYLDANFPFFNGFPLLPHLSHDDGRKLDLAFIYKQKGSNRIIPSGAATLTGYGDCDLPKKGEKDQPARCLKAGHWIYDITRRLAFRSRPSSIVVDDWRTGRLVKHIADDVKIGKLFLEPHLVNRWGVAGGKVRFQGCHAVRHDDHIHIQL